MGQTVFLGTQGWSYKSWVGEFYPQGTRPSDYLEEYAKHFRAVEIDSTYYGAPRPQTVDQWRQVTPDDFRFTAKFPQAITHEKMLRDVERETAQFLEAMSRLGNKLGPLLLQFPYQFKPAQREDLERFLAGLPPDFRYAVEVRNRGWLVASFFELLVKYRAALVLADYSYMPRLERATTDLVYIRWLGNRKDIPDDEYSHIRINRDQELDRWTQIIRRLSDQNVAVWGFANNHYQGNSPGTIRSLMRLLDLPGRIADRDETPPQNASQERRAGPRVDATYRLAYECFDPYGNKVDEGPAHTIDISGRGALIEISRSVAMDASMVLLVMAPFHMLMVRGSVVHSRRVENGSYHVGVRLTEMVEGSWDWLHQVIQERLAEKAE